MLEDIRAILPLALGVAISPIPIAAIIFVLMSKRGGHNGWAFLLGWFLGLILLAGGVAVLIRSIREPGENDSGSALPLIRIGLGLFLLCFAARCWSRRPRPGEEPGEPGWMKTLDQLNFPRAVLLGAGLVVLNLKNFPISISAASILARDQSKPGEFAITLLVFAFVASVGVTAPVIVTRLGGETSDRVLHHWKQWLSAHNATILSGLFLVLGLTALCKGAAAFL